eukprot:TRINITY_DN65674_c0_g1_i1.p1 TRINITY_DN65674_c0_g1~~TRINITY_DN65674_c0_g1_i1.p1  ORF type:complete len:308 (+),score=72.15 TRINITY_DN65674_c0_g1_i1:57-926(+)
MRRVAESAAPPVGQCRRRRAAPTPLQSPEPPQHLAQRRCAAGGALRATGCARFRPTAAPLDRWALNNRLTPPELPFPVPWDRFSVDRRKHWVGTEHTARGKPNSLRWYPKVTVSFSVGPDCDWIPGNTLELLKEKYPIYYDEDDETFSLDTYQGATFEASLEQVLDTLMYILLSCHQLANRDGSQFRYTRAYYQWGLPLVFRYREQQWRDRKRHGKANITWSRLMDPYITPSGVHVRVGGYQPGDSPGGGGYTNVDQIRAYNYDANAGWAMESMSRTHMELTGRGVDWT